MHAFFLTRGAWNDVELVMDFLKTRVLWLECTATDGSKIKVPYSGLLQPIQLWSYVFPKEYQREVCTALKFHEKDRFTPPGLKNDLSLSVLRKLLHCEPVPSFTPVPDGQGLFMPVHALANVQVTPIGLKKDVDVVETSGLTHEAI